MVPRTRIVSLAIVLSLLLTSCSFRTSSSPQRYSVRFAATACPAILASGVTAHCGSLIVPQRRTKPDDPTLHIAVAVFKSAAKHPRPDPVVFLMGGPGDPAIGGLGKVITPESDSTIVGDRDLVVVDYRGIGYSRPVLPCPQVRTISQQPLAVQRRGMAAVLAAQRDEYRRCRDTLVRHGIDLGAFTTSEIAADIADLRSALGYRIVNLFGVSYGTRVALSIMRDHPQGIRSVVLYSVVTPEFDDAWNVRGQAGAFATLFAGCGASALCRREYPHLDQEFYGLVSRLNRHPVVVRGGSTPALLTGTILAQAVFLGMYSYDLIPILPRMIHQVAAGDTSTLTSILSSLRSGRSGRAIGLTTSVDCGEDVEPDTPADIEAAIASLPSPIRSDASMEESLGRRVCASWGVPAVNAREKTPVHSPIPTLILDGQYDPETPPWYGALVMKTLTHGYRFVFPGMGHGIRFASTCANSITWAFFDHPGRRPDSSCIAAMPPAF